MQNKLKLKLLVVVVLLLFLGLRSRVRHCASRTYTGATSEPEGVKMEFRGNPKSKKGGYESAVLGCITATSILLKCIIRQL